MMINGWGGFFLLLPLHYFCEEIKITASLIIITGCCHRMALYSSCWEPLEIKENKQEETAGNRKVVL